MRRIPPLAVAALLAASALPAAAGGGDEFVTQGPSQGFDSWKRMGWNMAILHRLAGQPPGDSAYERAVSKELDRLVQNDPRFAWLKDPSPELKAKAETALQGRRESDAPWTRAEIDAVLSRQKQAIDGMYSDWRASRAAATPPAAGAPSAPAPETRRSGPDAAGITPEGAPPIPAASVSAADGAYAAAGGGRGGAGPNGAEPPSSSAPSLRGNKAFSALKDPGAFGRAREDDLAGGSGGAKDGASPRPARAQDGNGPRRSAAAPGGTAAAGAAGAARAGAPEMIGERGAAAAFASGRAASHYGTGATAPFAPAARSGGAPAAGEAAGGNPSRTGAGPAAGAPKSAPAAPEAAAPAAPKRADGELSDDEKKELAEIGRLLDQAAEGGPLDLDALAGAADQLPEGSLALQTVKDRVRDLIAMAGGELSMAQRQEVYELAAKLGMSEAQARALVRSLERAEPPSPSFGRPRSRAETWWRALVRLAKSWWRRLLELLGLAAPAR